MHTRQELMKILGFSYPQLRKRLDCLARVDGLLVGQVSKGSNGKLEYSAAVIEMLREVDSLASKPGKDLEQAARELRAKLKGNGGKEVATAASNRVNLGSNPLEVEVRYLKRMVDERDARIRQLESEVLFLRTRIEELTPLALPRPRRWLAWLRPSTAR